MSQAGSYTAPDLLLPIVPAICICIAQTCGPRGGGWRLLGVFRPRSARRVPPPNHGSALTCGDGINLFDNLPAIADRSVSEDRDRPPWLARLS